jgi:hypothetical protein
MRDIEIVTAALASLHARYCSRIDTTPGISNEVLYTKIDLIEDLQAEISIILEKLQEEDKRLQREFEESGLSF